MRQNTRRTAFETLRRGLSVSEAALGRDKHVGSALGAAIKYPHSNELNAQEGERSLDDAGKNAEELVEARFVWSKIGTSERARSLPVLQEWSSTA